MTPREHFQAVLNMAEIYLHRARLDARDLIKTWRAEGDLQAIDEVMLALTNECSDAWTMKNLDIPVEVLKGTTKEMPLKHRYALFRRVGLVLAHLATVASNERRHELYELADDLT